MTITRTTAGITNSATTQNSITFTLGSAPSDGDLLVIAAVWGPLTVTDTLAGIWQAVDVRISNLDFSRLYYKVCGAGESTTQTVATLSGGLASVILAGEGYQITNGWHATPLEATTQNIDDDATKTTTGTCDPTDSVERLIIGAAFSDGNRSFSAEKVNGSTTDVSERGDIGIGTANGGGTVALWDLLQASTASGNHTAEGVALAADNGAVFIAIFRPAATAQDAPELRGRPFGLRGASQMRQLLAQ